MRRERPPVRFALLGACLLALGGAARAQDLLPKIDEYMNAAAKVEHFSGAILVARDGKVLASKGYGMADVENDVPNTPETKMENYYPGTGYVDVLSLDGYNWGSAGGGGWQSFREVFEDIYPKLAAKGKPIMIGEMASAQSGGDKAQWIDNVIPTLRSDYPLIKGVIWFDVNKVTDWRIRSSSESLAAFVRRANDPYFNP